MISTSDEIIQESPAIKSTAVDLIQRILEACSTSVDDIFWTLVRTIVSRIAALHLDENQIVAEVLC